MSFKNKNKKNPIRYAKYLLLIPMFLLLMIIYMNISLLDKSMEYMISEESIEINEIYKLINYYGSTISILISYVGFILLILYTDILNIRYEIGDLKNE